jgi:hypothetical protein
MQLVIHGHYLLEQQLLLAQILIQSTLILRQILPVDQFQFMGIIQFVMDQHHRPFKLQVLIYLDIPLQFPEMGQYVLETPIPIR